MARPVEVLGAVRRALADDGSMLIVDERTGERFTGQPDELEAYFYGWSIFDCLPTGMYAQPSAGTGTVMRRTGGDPEATAAQLRPASSDANACPSEVPNAANERSGWASRQ